MGDVEKRDLWYDEHGNKRTDPRPMGSTTKKDDGSATARAAAQDVSKLNVGAGKGAFVPPKMEKGEDFGAYGRRVKKARADWDARQSGQASAIDDRLKTKGMDQP